ncbi:cupin domain-containing protein [Rhodovulum sp. DZ06]|uniref:cupin domain-containing protein n=1 Tax=Rhodovulum sp. DZ06 TaxID=3425126 RepID=UPI003D3530F6
MADPETDAPAAAGPGGAETAPLALPALLAGGWDALPFEPFKPGIEIHRIRAADPAVALLRYAPGAAAPKHVHEGLETILVLSGAQSDENGTYETGALVLNPAGTVHSVWSDPGCVVLIQWEKPVRFL